MNRFTFAALLTLFCAQATLTASTLYTLSTPTLSAGTTAVGGATFDSGTASPTYTSGMWTEDFSGTNTSTGEQIVCTVGLGLTTDEQKETCGNAGPGSAAHIGVDEDATTGQPSNSSILPNGTSYYVEDDGDPAYGAPVSTLMNLIVGDSYQLSFYQASNEEDGNDKAYSDSWLVYILPGVTAGEYICPTGICSTPVDPGSVAPVFTSTPMANPGASETPWELQTYTFKATNVNEILEFVTDAVGTSGFQPPLLDLAAVTTNVASPEPGTWLLTILGIGLVFAAGKLRRRSGSAYKRVLYR